MKVALRNHYHGCSTVSDRDEDHELGAHKFITITESNVGRNHLSRNHHKFNTYKNQQAPSGCYNWIHQQVKPEPGVEPAKKSRPKINIGRAKIRNKKLSRKTEGSTEAEAFQSA
ncbi:MAG: hypothetical protein ACREBR_01620, partial [bacterium]